jgi:ketosteroid isomerase-like protein
MRLAAIAACAALGLAACASIAPGPPSRADLTREVERTERAFAKTMADRDAAAFAGFISEEAIFFSGEEALRGKAAVTARWARFFTAPEPPFSWEPERVEVLASGTLALSTGPVRNARGKLIARFSSIWRRESPGVWRIVFDRGSPACDCRAGS